ncbi:MAG: PrsW family intramembrane metalloprotease [Treponema sp.]|nr:PrsW family intramembrane metalloprotease [Treponema sp.]
MFFIPIIICFIPCITGFFIFRFGCKVKTSHLLIAALLGLISVLPIGAIQYVIPDMNILIKHRILYQLLKSIILYGFVEEVIKALMILPLPKKNNSALNFLLISFLFGLTLGCFESVVYYLDKLNLSVTRGGSLLYVQLFERIFSSDLIHMSCAGLCGLFIYTCSQKKARISFFVLAVILHGLYDFFACFKNGLKWFAIPVILLALIECRIKYKAITQDQQE